eukprot:1148955-Pelagomonas_calceolata.AAC.1
MQEPGADLGGDLPAFHALCYDPHLRLRGGAPAAHLTQQRCCGRHCLRAGAAGLVVRACAGAPLLRSPMGARVLLT